MKRFLFAAAFALATAHAALAQVGAFELRADGAVLGVFAECGRMGSENDIIESLGPAGFTTKIPGRLRVGDVVCARSLSADLTLWQWRSEVEIGDLSSAVRDVSIRYFDPTGTPVARWNLRNAWPSKILLEGTGELVVFEADQLERDEGLATPALTWAAPDDIVYGTALGPEQLNAESSAAGSFSYAPAAGTFLPAGTHLLTATFTPDDSETFTGATATVSLAVLKATLTVVADDASSIWLDPIPPLTYHTEGFVLSDGADAVTGVPSLATSATNSSPPGTYSIMVGAGTLASSNYAFAFQPGTLTILGGDALTADASSIVEALLEIEEHPGDRQKLTAVRAHLEAAAEAVWLPSGLLAREGGKNFFDACAKAAVLLATMLGGEDEAAIGEILDLLVSATRLAALGAIHAGEAGGADPRTLDKARADLARGDAHASRSRYHNAILEYRSAWSRLTE